MCEITEQVRTRTFSPTEIIEVLLDQIRKTDDKVKAYVTVCERQAIETARMMELQPKGHDLGPLGGIPISVKDLFETAGIKTTCGSRLMQGYVPTSDCTVVKRLKEAGAIVLGKLNTHEFALGGVTPPTRNPWDLKCIPGGSSGGSAAAIAAGSAIATTGSDTGGSIRVPASLCGAVGLKPTYGRVSRAGVFPESWSLDHVGPITRRVDDAAFLLSYMAGFDELDPTSSRCPTGQFTEHLNDSVRGLRVGVPVNHFFELCEEDVRNAVESAIDVIERLGCTTVDFKFPYVPEIRAAYTAIDSCETSAYHENRLSQRAKEFAEDSRVQIEAGLFIPATYYINAQRVRGLVLPEILKLFKQFDAIVTPTVPAVAPEVGVFHLNFEGIEEYIDVAMMRYCAPFNFLGLPALSVPCGFSTSGLPIGMQLIGNLYDEQTILRLGHAYEEATLWHTMFPDIESRI